MSLNKAIKHGKEKRKQHKGAKAIDATCRNHGSDYWCEENRKIKYIRKQQAAEEKESEVD